MNSNINDLTNEELNKLKNSKSEIEWNRICDEIKRSRNGCYPPDWFPKVLASGLISKVQMNWK